MMDRSDERIYGEIAESYRQVGQKSGFIGTERIFMRSDVKARLFPDTDVFVIDGTAVPISIDDRIPETDHMGKYSSIVYVGRPGAYD